MSEMEGMSQSCLTGRETGWLRGDGGVSFALPRRKCSDSRPSLISDPTARRSRTQIQL